MCHLCNGTNPTCPICNEQPSNLCVLCGGNNLMCPICSGKTISKTYNRLRCRNCGSTYITDNNNHTPVGASCVDYFYAPRYRCGHCGNNNIEEIADTNPLSPPWSWPFDNHIC